MGATEQARRVADFADVVAGCRTPPELWSVVASWLQRHVGFDAGYIASTLGSSADCQGAVLEHDGEALRSNIGRYLGEITREELALYMNRARPHTYVWDRSRRARMLVFREVLDPSGAKHVAVRASLRGDVLLGFNLERRSGTAFNERELALIDAVAPIVHLGDAVTRVPESPEGLRSWATEHGLTAREAEVANLVARGLKNVEIADLLNIHQFTVRNTLARVFEKAGVAGRAELTFEALQSPSAPRRASGDPLFPFYARAGQTVRRARFTASPVWTPSPSVLLARAP